MSSSSARVPKGARCLGISVDFIRVFTDNHAPSQDEPRRQPRDIVHCQQRGVEFVSQSPFLIDKI